ncbi:putative cytochrome P450 monooxygenase [Stachybotrys elegans]|uniref:Cytochrome P450 monooxygenase n=1 Tax=Stachybotrys elegans TaxID=80388 RepID=A0A8K0SCT6_9HYPO|nr:putative cytochrome P450 monooxygenase [Stachybotrys elegans]
MEMRRVLFTDVLVNLVLHLVYNVFLHPLRSFPGPWYAKAGILWLGVRAAKGDHWCAVHELRLKYCPVVRITPNELSFVDARAWKDIYGHRPGGTELPKGLSQTFSSNPQHPSIVFAPLEQHAKLRKLMSLGFSDAALRQQEHVLNNYAIKLVDGLKSQGHEPVDITKWFNFATFDMNGHLAFAESFNCLSSSTYHPWVSKMLSTVKFVTWTRILGRVAPRSLQILLRFLPERVRREHAETWEMAKLKVLRRRDCNIKYTDLMTNLIEAEKDGLLYLDDLTSNAPILVLAGSETTATSLSGTTYYLLKHPAAYSRLVEEIRSNIKSHADISLSTTSQLPYLTAVIEESLRMYSPANSNHPRVTPVEGAVICDRFVPGNTLVGIPHYVCFRSPTNFTDPDQFIPERSLKENSRYAGDKKEASQSFHLGPRNCIGRNLAMIEMRLILAHLLLAFDIELAPESERWENQQVLTTWIKGPPLVHLKPRKNSVP